VPGTSPTSPTVLYLYLVVGLLPPPSRLCHHACSPHTPASAICAICPPLKPLARSFSWRGVTSERSPTSPCVLPPRLAILNAYHLLSACRSSLSCHKLLRRPCLAPCRLESVYIHAAAVRTLESIRPEARLLWRTALPSCEPPTSQLDLPCFSRRTAVGRGRQRETATGEQPTIPRDTNVALLLTAPMIGPAAATTC
jgi:hypothetical protein